MLRVGVAGTDDWCVNNVQLYFNGRLAFDQNPPPGGACAGSGNYVEFSSSALRNNYAWVNYGTPPALPSKLSAAELRALVQDVTGSAMLAAPGMVWNPAVPLNLVKKTASSIRVSFGIRQFDPAGIETPFTVTISYDLQLFTGTDGKLHATKANPSCCYHYTMSDAVVSQLDTALSLMTARPAPHDPLRFGVDAFTNFAWSYTPVLA
jgi:hypothetical protein